MVKTEGDVMDIHPIERMERLEEIKLEKKGAISTKKKELEELEKKKLKEIEEWDAKKKRDLEEIDKRKKELVDLEKKKLKEIDETEELIEKSFQDLMRHKRKIIEEEDSQKSKTLESITSSTPSGMSIAPNANYGRFFEELQAPTKIYQVTNTGFYANLLELRNRASRGELNEREEEFIDRLKNRFESFEDNAEYMRSDANNYVRRSMNIIKEIAKYQGRID